MTVGDVNSIAKGDNGVSKNGNTAGARPTVLFCLEVKHKSIAEGALKHTKCFSPRIL
jgi:hypothetical protein